jgi:hypothetical protein
MAMTIEKGVLGKRTASLRALTSKRKKCDTCKRPKMNMIKSLASDRSLAQALDMAIKIEDIMNLEEEIDNLYKGMMYDTSKLHSNSFETKRF